MQAPGGPDEDREGGFEHGGWLAPHFNEKMGEAMDEEFSRAGAFLLGRKTYEIFAAYWPQVDEPGVARVLNKQPKYVASRTLQSADWHNSTILKGDVAAEVAKLKAEIEGEINVPGSANFIQALLQHDLVDEWHIWTFPVVLGTGKRLFGDGAIPIGLRLKRSEAMDTGVIFQVYERAGSVEYGVAGS
jgi:dihydrofolate reductase